MTVSRFSQASVSTPTKYRSLMAGSTWDQAPGDYELISTTILGSSASTVTFSNLGTIAAGYKHLQIRMTIRCDAVIVGNYGLFRINGDTAANYAGHRVVGNGTTVASGSDVSQSGMYVGDFTGSSAASGHFGVMIIDYLDFASTAKNKTVRYSTGSAGSGGSYSVQLRSSLWISTSAITSLSFAVQDGSNWIAGSRFSLYGLK